MPIRILTTSTVSSASDLSTATTNFNQILTASDINVQLALDALNSHVHNNSSVDTTTSTPVTVDKDLVNVDATATPLTISLYTAVGNSGKEVAVRKKDSSSNPVTVVPSGSQTINGASSVTLTYQDEFLVLKSDGTNWFVSTAIAYSDDPMIHIGTTAPSDTTKLWYDTN